MSQETAEWLNQNCLIGFTAKRGEAWHYKASAQGAEPNHYDGAIPIEDVRRRLFDWKPVEIVPTLEGRVDQDHKAIVHPNTGKVFAYMSDAYAVHHYDEWLLSNLSSLIDADLDIASAGLLKGGGVAWVQIEMPDNITIDGYDIDFRPFLAATTSYDGSFATQYREGVTRVVCDNTLSAFNSRSERGFKVKHTRHSIGRLADARQALGLVYSTADAFTKKAIEMCQTTVSDKQWDQFTMAYAPELPHYTDREKANASRVRSSLDGLWRADQRVAPWANTAFGVVQAVNTYAHHVQRVRGRGRAERNISMALHGQFDRVDQTTLRVLEPILA